MSRYLKLVSGSGKVPSSSASGSSAGAGMRIAGREGWVNPKTTRSVWIALRPSLRYAGLKAMVSGSPWKAQFRTRSEEHTSELQSRFDLVCRLLLEKKKYSTT